MDIHKSVSGRDHLSRGAGIQKVQKTHGNAFIQRLVAGPLAAEQEEQVARQLLPEINAARGGGQPLDEAVSDQTESTFGRDLHGVRVHTDAQADRLSRNLNARAFTVGRDIFFRDGEYSPQSDAGRETIAHELTHVVQNVIDAPTRVLSSPQDASETEARAAKGVPGHGHAAGTRAILSRIAETESESSDTGREGRTILAQARELFERGQYPQAIILFERCIGARDFPADGLSAIYLNMAHANFHLERWEAASFYYELFLRNPGRLSRSIALASERLAQARAASGVLPETESDPEAGDVEAPPSVDATQLFAQGKTAYRRRDYETAINLFERARMAPENTDRQRAALLNNLGWANLRLQRYVTAKAYFGECINLGHYRATARRGLNEAHEGFTRDAETVMQRESRPERRARQTGGQGAPAATTQRRVEPLPNKEAREAIVRIARVIVPTPLQLPGGQTIFIPRGILGDRVRMAYSRETYAAAWSEAGGRGEPPRWGFHEFGENGLLARTWLNLSDQTTATTTREAAGV
jgi:tetratricopeptide (TPR) repeat protein